MKRLMDLFALAVLAVAIATPAMAADYDVVINNGRVMEPETNFDGVRNVGIKDGKIAAITEDAIEGNETIDASGHVVAPAVNERLKLTRFQRLNLTHPF